MASDPFAPRVFPYSLLASVSIHALFVLSLMTVWRSVTFGPGNSAGYVAGTWGAPAEPDIFLGSESDALDSLAGDKELTLPELSPQPEALAVSGSLVPPDAPDGLSDESDMPAAESPAEPDVLTLSEPVNPTDADTSLTYESEPTAASDHAIEARPPELASLRGSEGSRVFTNKGPVAAQGASFFGTVAEGDRFVYLVDNSPSMNIGRGRAHGDVSRLIRAFGELKASVERLAPGQSFYVILFNGQTRRMFDDHSTPPRFFPATPSNKLRFEKWLASVGTGEATDPLPALRMGLDMRPSALFLLSDGLFDVKETTLVDFIDRHNATGAPIHTIAYEDERSCHTMWRIAYSTGGDYRFVESPARAREREEAEDADAGARRRLSEEMRAPGDSGSDGRDRTNRRGAYPNR
jgi:hypothetical protein